MSHSCASICKDAACADACLVAWRSFAGGLSWQMGLFDVNQAADWDEVVEVLVSNTPERTDKVTLVFERPL